MKYDKQTDPFYKSAAWRRVRQDALDRDAGICQDCLKQWRDGIIPRPSSAVTVHHIKPLKEYPELSLDMDNLISLCESCHNKRHPERAWVRQEKEKKTYPAAIHKL